MEIAENEAALRDVTAAYAFPGAHSFPLLC